ncbi:uncharacterized protein LOC144017529 isoform X2 [Festucalex cinctus]
MDIRQKDRFEDFHFGVRDYSHNLVSFDVTVGQLYKERKMGMLRVYMTSKAKAILLSDVSSDIETPDEQPQKRRSLRKRSQRHQHMRTRINQVDNPESSSDLDPAPSSSMQTGELMDRSRPASLEMSDTEEALHPPSSDELGQLTDRHGSSLEDDEVQFGPISGDDDDQDSTIPWNASELNSMQYSTPNEEPVPVSSRSVATSPDFTKEQLLVKLRRVNIVDDVLHVFMEPNILNVNLKMEFTNEKAVDSDGVSREAYSAFWEHSWNCVRGKMNKYPD